MTRLLLTGGGGAGVEALWRLWSGRYDLHIADADPDAIPPAVPNDRRHRLPMAKSKDFVSATAALFQDLGIDILIPAVDEELTKLAALTAVLPEIEVLAPAPKFIAVMQNKLDSARALAGAGLAAPRTVPIEDAATIGFPCIVKPCTGRGSRGVRIVRDRRTAEACANLAAADENPTIAQELLEGQEYTVLVAADAEARLHAVVPIRVSLKRGVTIRAETDQASVVVAACRAVHAAFPTPGAFNVQLMLTQSGDAVPFEINPRVSTTLCLAIAAGIDPVAIYRGVAKAESPDLLPFTSGLSLRRYWANEIGASPA